jgi:hypothetical protein
MTEIDYSRIEHLLLRENHNVGLAFSEGYVFLRVLTRELVWLTYDPSIEGLTNLVNIPGRTFRTKQLFSSPSGELNVPNVIKVDKDFHVYQIFIGIQPSQAKLFVAAESTEQRELDVALWGTNSDYRFGYVDGFQSQFYRPGPQGELFVTPQLGETFAVFNPMPYTISPVFSFTINRMQVAVIKDANMISRMLQGVTPARLAPVGGGIAPPRYNMKEKWRVKPVTLDATADEVIKAAAGG